MKTVVHAACPHDCPDACGVLITVEDGRATKIQGDPDHPVTRGFLCAKVAKYLDRVYSPDRVLYPMRRIAAKGPAAGAALAGRSARATPRRSCAPHGQPRAAVLTQTFPPQAASQIWERISWDEALDEIASRFRAISTEFGSEAILPYSFGGTLGALNGASMDRRFFHRLGASQLERTICSAAGEAGLESVLGVKLGTEPEQFRHSLGIEYPRQQRTPVAVCCRGPAQRREAGGDRPVSHANCGLCRLVLAHQPGHGCGPGPRHDARDHRRKPARCRLH